IPYLTTFVSNNPFSLLSQVLYGLDFILINIILYGMSRSLLDINSHNEFLVNALDLKNAIIIPSIFLIVGFVVALMGYPIAISICCLITIVRSIIYSLNA
ncbi:MAG: DUF1211 domain-containing protein, partial [Methanobrevibacter sp.]|nr:DUF1211 domain-containing protein [Methanobrevibacter sp.]